MAARQATNKLLHKARKSKADEFYTQLCDIENELKHYKPHFKDKVVYCNCDDPSVSNFYKYFVANFYELGLKKVIASRYAGDGAMDADGLFSYLDSDDKKSQSDASTATATSSSAISSTSTDSTVPEYDEDDRVSVIKRVDPALAAAGGDTEAVAGCAAGGATSAPAGSYDAAKGSGCATDGLFSAEIALKHACAHLWGSDESEEKSLSDRAQGRSLLRGQVTEFDGQEITTRDLDGNGDFRSEECLEILKSCDIVVTNPPFSLFREFISTLVAHKKDFLVIANVNAITYKEIFSLIQEGHAWLGVGLGRDISGFIVPPHYILYGSEVYIDSKGNRIISPNNCLWLTTLDIAKRHVDIPLTKTYEGNEDFYPRYDNLDGINVNKTKDIPKDYPGLMGVPITFLHKYNPDQFELVRFRKGLDNKDLSINGKCPYFRIVIRNRRLQQN